MTTDDKDTDGLRSQGSRVRIAPGPLEQAHKSTEETTPQDAVSRPPAEARDSQAATGEEETSPWASLITTRRLVAGFADSFGSAKAVSGDQLALAFLLIESRLSEALSLLAAKEARHE